MKVRQRPRLYAVVAIVCAVVVALGGCGGADVNDLTLSQKPTRSNTATTAAPSTTPVLATGCDPNDPTPSLRPLDALPKPGNMPAGSLMAEIQNRGELVAGVDQNTLLFGFRDPKTGEIVGFDIDVLKTIAKTIFGEDGHLRLKAIKYSERVPEVVAGVNAGGVDIVADTMTINCARWAKVAFSTQYYDAGQKLLVRTDSTAKSIKDMSGKRVCAAAGSTSVDNIRTANPAAKVVEVVDQTDCLIQFQQGTVDAISTDDTILLGLARQDPYAKLLPDRFTAEPYGLAMPLDRPEFTRFVNGVLEAMRHDNTWATISQRWLGTPTEPPPAKYRD